jgi:hypothetical protein
LPEESQSAHFSKEAKYNRFEIPASGRAAQLLSKNKKAALCKIRAAFSNLIPAATYVPTQLPVQYHRPGEA